MAVNSTQVATRYGRMEILPDDQIVCASLVDYGEWAQLEIDMMRSFISPGAVVLDAGAFIGTHTLAFADKVGPKGRVYAFEPRAHIHRLLETNIQLNGFACAQAMQLGLASKAEMFHSSGDAGKNFGGFSLTPGETSADATSFDCRALDSFDFPSFDVLKLDLEGMEVAALIGAQKTIARSRPVIFAEVNSITAGLQLREHALGVEYLVFAFLAPAFNPLNFAANLSNWFGISAELTFVLLPREKITAFTFQIRENKLAQLVTPDDVAVALMYKPQYYPEVAALSPVVAVLGSEFPTPTVVLQRQQLAQLQQSLLASEQALLEQRAELATSRSYVGELKAQYARALESQVAEQTVFAQRLASIDSEKLAANHALALSSAALISLRDQLEAKIAEVAQVRHQSETLFASTSWRMTAPLRRVVVFARRARSAALSSVKVVARSAYDLFPASIHTKQRIKSIVFSFCGPLFSSSQLYQDWKASSGVKFGGKSRLNRVVPDFPWPPFKLQDRGSVDQGVWADYELVSAAIARAREVQVTPPNTRKREQPALRAATDVSNLLSQMRFPTPSNQPRVSIVVPVFEQTLLTAQCLLSISEHTDPSIDYEIVIADDGSSLALQESFNAVANLVWSRSDVNQGFLANCNRVAETVRGDAIVFLNNDVLVHDAWLTELLRALAGNDVGIVGPKILFEHGALQEAGARLNSNFESVMIGLNQSPNQPRFAYDREVEYLSGACLMIKRALFERLGGFDARFKPAYCEDVDLCLKVRQAGYKVMFCYSSCITHTLSASSNEGAHGSVDKHLLVAVNSQKLKEKWSGTAQVPAKVRAIAFYLPQFHAIPENDAWWGKGFTEWTNVRKASPNYEGHLQPRTPQDLGYYDLADPLVLHQQAALAQRYGLEGFCFYYYRFAGKRLLEKPLNQMIGHDAPDIPFCICWANENWTRRWDGRDSEVLIAQQHSDEDSDAVFQDMLQYLQDKKYLTVSGRPLVLIYRAALIPGFLEMTHRWREHARASGLPGLYLVNMETFELVQKQLDPSAFGCDAAMEFPPQGLATPRKPSGALINQSYKGLVADYRELAVNFAARPAPPYTRFSGVTPGWDNTPRRKDEGVVIESSSPGAFQAWVEASSRYTMDQFVGDERLLFINAWNEWAEGAYLEPDEHFGHGYLEALRNALHNTQSDLGPH
jgi:FkbM family methyltransferase